MAVAESVAEGTRPARPLGLVQRIFGGRATIATVPQMPNETTNRPASISADAGEYVDVGVRSFAASIQGLSHQTEGSVRQDSYAIVRREGCIVVAVADGVGSAPLSHIGSHIAAQMAVAITSEGVFNSSMIATVVAQLRTEARRLGRPVDELSTTLLVLRIEIGEHDEPWTMEVVEWGDSRVSVYTPGSVVDGHPDWRHVCPDPSTDLGNSVQALPSFLAPTTFARTKWLPGEVLLAASDGIDAHLRPENFVGHGLAEAWNEPPSIFQFIADVGFERAGARDDRTAVCLFRSPTGPTRENTP